MGFGGCYGSPAAVPFFDPMGAEYRQRIQRQIRRHPCRGHCRYRVLAGGHQCGYGHRSFAGCGDSSAAVQLWRVIPDFNHGGHGSFDEYQHEAFYVSIRPGLFPELEGLSFLFVA